jgi:glycine betaine/proline transport system permease protein
MAANSKPLNELAQKVQSRPGLRWLFWLGAAALLLLLAWGLNEYRGGYYELPVAQAVNTGMDWLLITLDPFFDAIRMAMAFILNNLEDFLLWLPWWVTVAFIALIAWRLAGNRIAIFSAIAMYFILSLGLWELCMETLALIATAVLVSLVLGIPIGILAARSDRVDNAVRPVLDAMQTMPAFVYLIPALMFFGIGTVPGVIATVIFAVPPSVRLTNLGIRQVPKDLVEAAHTFGSTERQLLFKLQLPLALPSIMAGVNQTIMLSLSMVVLAALIAAGGLGREVIMALGQVDIGRGFVAGVAIVLVAMILDRVTQSLAKKRQTITH